MAYNIDQLLDEQRRFQRELAEQEEEYLQKEFEKSGLPIAEWLRFSVYEKGDVIYQFDEATNSYSAHHMSRVRLKTPEELEEYDRILARRTPEEIAQHNKQIADFEASRKTQGV